ncbi:unnamed protein product, partial [Effrenium voratum]
KDVERDVRPATETLDRPSPRARVDLSDACAVAASYDGTAVYVAGRSGLKRFDLPDLQLTASAPYKGTAEPAGYADVAAGDGFVVCVDLDGCVFRFSKMCELQAKRAYQPSVVKHSQRLVASQLERSAVPVLGLEGGFGGASRLAASSGFVYLGGCDGVVTTYAAGTLSLTSRCRLGTAGIRALFLSAYQRLYCAELSSVHVLALPGMYELARLRGGPRVPVFGSISAVVESSAGDYAFVADVGGPAIHLWSTKTWQWLARAELPQGGGPARHLAAAPQSQVLYASTDARQLLAFDVSRLPPVCISEGPEGGPMAVLEGLVVLSQGALRLNKHL